VIGAALLLLLGVHTMRPPVLHWSPSRCSSPRWCSPSRPSPATTWDLKTGQLVDATPWKQQVALVIGVLAGAAIIPPSRPREPRLRFRRRARPLRDIHPPRRNRADLGAGAGVIHNISGR
jgi:hypothetical protein